MATRNVVILWASDIQKFWEKVDKKGPNDCWLWTASKHPFGYGWFGVEGENHSAHRISWIIHHGQVPKGMQVLHNCPGGDNPSCVNPSHLWLGTQGDNMRDRQAKGRDNHPCGEEHRARQRKCVARGDNHCECKLKKKQCLEARQLYKEGWTMPGIARFFGVHRNVIWYAIFKRVL